MDKLLKILVWPIIIIPLIYLAIVWDRLPETVALHFNLKGTPDRFGSRNELLLSAVILAVFNAGIYLLLTNIYRIDPKRSAPENKTRLQRIAFAVTIFTSLLLCIIIYNGTHPNVKFSTRLIFVGTGLLFCFIGNYIHNIRPNYFAGIRLPWTLESENNWRKTHLLAGKLFFAGGLLMAINSLFFPLTTSIVIFFVIAAVITIIPIVYSYRIYKREKAFK